MVVVYRVLNSTPIGYHKHDKQRSLVVKFLFPGHVNDHSRQYNFTQKRVVSLRQYSANSNSVYATVHTCTKQLCHSIKTKQKHSITPGYFLREIRINLTKRNTSIQDSE